MVAAASVLIALLLLPPAAFRVARRVSAELPPFGVEALTLGAPVAMTLLVVPLVGRATHRFDAGLLALALVSALAFWGTRRLLPAQGPAVPARRRASVWLVTALVAGAYAFIAVRYQMHDEHPIFGHASMVEELRNGAFPPYLPPIPRLDVRYHYGFDLLSGALARGFGLSTDNAIDLVTVALVILMSFTAAAAVSALGAYRSAPFAAFAIHFGAGLAWLILAGVPGRHPRCLVQYHHPSCSAELFPTPFLNVFQHPVAVGVPLFLLFFTVFLAWAQASYRRRPLGYLLLLILPALAMGQVVYFALGLLATSFALLISREAHLFRRFLPIAGLGLLLAILSGGMFSPTPLNDSGLLVFLERPGFPSPSAWAILRYNAINLGVGFLALPVLGLLALARGDPQAADPYRARSLGSPSFTRQLGLRIWVAFAVGGALAPQLMTYTRSWDIVKFPSAAAFILSLLWVATVDHALGLRGWRWLQRAGRVLLLGSGILAFIFVAFPLEQSLRLYDLGNSSADPGVKSVIEWFRAKGVVRSELILAQSNVASELAVYGGLSVVGSDYDLLTQGLRRSWLERQDQLAEKARASMDPVALEDLGVSWLVYSDEELNNLGAAAKEKLLLGESPYELAASLPQDRPERRRRIWRFRAPSSPDPAASPPPARAAGP
ncbi:MAG: hypothetical protein U1E65_06390 [Myxococcota bacterium]